MEPIKQHIKILVVDDNLHDIIALKRIMRNASFSCEIFSCERAEEAVSFLLNKNKDIDVIVSDYNLPGMTGMDFYKKITQKEIKLPFVLVTGVGSEYLAVEALRTGIDDYMVKDTGGVYLDLLPIVIQDLIHRQYEKQARLQAEEELLNYQKGLEELVQQRTSELLEANRKLQIEIQEKLQAEKALRESEALLRHSQKMEAVGRLAGGIAHDFNNILTVINAYVDISLMDLDESHPLWENFIEIKKAGERGASLTRQLLAFSRKQKLQPKVINLNEIITEMRAMIRRVLHEDVELLLLLDPDLGCVEIDPGQMEQVLLNTAINARDAMPHGGSFTLDTANLTLNDGNMENHPGIPQGDYVLLSAKDTGMGMSKDVASHVFEPFFTTKEEGKGTGLGLATVYGIISQSGGHIRIESAENKGTTFYIYLPCVKEADVISEEESSFNGEAGGTETVLVVEDDESLRKTTGKILRMNGYNVIEARHGNEAIMICENNKHDVHLVISDLIMPAMTGSELIKKLRQINSNLKFILMSGYSEDSLSDYNIGDIFHIPYLEKPAKPKKFLSMVRDVLDETWVNPRLKQKIQG